MTHPFHIANYDTSGTTNAQDANNGLKLSTNAGTPVTPVVTASTVRGHIKAIPDKNPAGKKYVL